MPCRNLLPVLLLCLLCMFAGISANAQTLAALQQAGSLKVKAWVEPAENIIARQQVNLQIEIATDRWFSGGTRIGRFEIDDAIVLQREKFAVNATRQENGKTWTVQLWTLAVYPMRPGVFDVPKIPLRLAIAGENLEAITGEVVTQSFSFIASLPEDIPQDADWIASTRFTVEERFDRPLDELAPGDALTRTITLSADNLPAMMLPEVSVDHIEGVSVYATPPKLDDKVNRGDYIARRTQTLTYVFEQTGDYRLAKQRFFWWNLETQSFETVDLEAHNLLVGSAADKNQPAVSHRSLLHVMTFSAAAALLMAAAAVVLLAWLAWLRQRNSPSETKHKTKPLHLTEAALRKKFHQACAANDAKKALAMLYQWFDFYGGKAFQPTVRQSLNDMGREDILAAFNSVLQSVYARTPNQTIDLKRFSRLLRHELRRRRRKTPFSPESIEFKLN